MHYAYLFEKESILLTNCYEMLHFYGDRKRYFAMVYYLKILQLPII